MRPSLPTTAARVPAQRGGGTTPAVGRELRADIQALRALAVSLVVVYHLWPQALPGGYIGVDVFFVISGYLITHHLLTVRPTRVRDVVRFWERRIRRLAPAAMLVVATSLAVGVAFGPDSRRIHYAVESAMAGLNLENWFLAHRSVDYLAAVAAPSPVQHYWSLSVEEQFYFLWPLLLTAAALLAARRALPYRPVVLCLLAPVVLASLAFALHASGTGDPRAFFVTPTRVWELGAGALLAAAPLAAWSGRRARATVLAWCGLAAIAGSALLFSHTTPWPGPATIVPVAATALVIAARAPTGYGPGRLLAARPVQTIGTLSYSIYLWHWPLIVLLPSLTKRPLGGGDKLAVLVATLVLAGFTTRFVENRFRNPSAHPRATRRAFAGVAAATAAVVAVAGVVVVDAKRAETASFAEVATALRDDQCFGARALLDPAGCAGRSTGPLAPSSLAAIADRPAGWENGCLVTAPFTGAACRYGNPDARVRVALVGNSHGGHWLPALQSIAADRDWQITTFVAAGCSVSSRELVQLPGTDRRPCLEWGKRVLAQTKDFDVVVVSQLTGVALPGTHGTELPDAALFGDWVAGYRDYLAQWANAGVPVVVVRDTPLPSTTLTSVPDCLSVHGSDYAACGGARPAWLQPDPLAEAGRLLGSPLVEVADLSDYFCDATRCAAVVGRVPVYFDGSHLSATFATTMGPALLPYLDAALARG
ncbi:MAG: acyltransferase family protein [Sporichthyaceae bacterium]